jgi:hypothetical protein
VSVAENQLHPLEIEDARSAAHRASELQREVEDRLKDASRKLAEAERVYRKKLSERIVELKAEGMAVTMCGEVARGEKAVADLRYNRDVAAGVFEAAKQEAFRRGADRRDVDTLLNWSMKRDLRVDTPPADWGQQPTHGDGHPDFDPVTGEVLSPGVRAAA